METTLGYVGRALRVAGIAFLLSCQFLPVATFAANTGPLSIATSPLPIDLNAAPGSTVTASLRVKNNGTSPERLKVSLMKFSAKDDTGQPFLQPRGAGDSYFDWVSFSPSVFDAPPGEWQSITMTVKIPPSAAFGYYLAAVFSRADNVQPIPGAAAVSGSSATLILLDVASPNAKRQLEPVSFSADRQFYEFLPTTFKVTLHNSGNIHLAPQGNIFITRGKSQVGSILLNQAGGNILPQSSRSFTASWSDGFPVYVQKQQDGKPVFKNSQPVKQLKWDFTQVPKLRFGRYTASFTVVYFDGQRDVPLTGDVTFWVIPWRIIIGVVVIGIFMAIGLQSTFKKIWQKLTSRKT